MYTFQFSPAETYLLTFFPLRNCKVIFSPCPQYYQAERQAVTMSPNPRDNSVATKFILKLQWVILQLNLESEFWKEKKNRPGDCHHLECPGRWGLPAALRAGPAATMCTYQLQEVIGVK